MSTSPLRGRQGRPRTVRLGRLGLALAALAPLAAGLSAQGNLDLSVNNVIVVQTLPNVTLVGGKSTMVRTRVDVTGSLPIGTVVDGLLHVFVGGVELPESPIFSENGPFAPPVTGFSLNDLDDTLNFVFIPPASNDVELVVELNPPGSGQVFETNYANNSGTTGTLEFECKAKAEVVYVPIDYRPFGGETPNLPDLTLIEPGVGDNFLQAIYPSGDWEYHRSDVPRKIWFNSLAGTGSGLLNALLADLNMMSPQPDFIYGWVPGGLPYNGQASGIPGRAGMGNTEPIRHQRTFAHELGHCFGRVHISNTTNRVGIDVEHHLNITQALPRVKRGTLFDVMVAGLLTQEAWVYDINYEAFANNNVFVCSTAQVAAPEGRTLMIGGIWNRAQRTVALTDAVAFEGGIPTPTVPLAQADLVLRVHAAGAVQELGLPVNSSTDSCGDASDSWEEVPDAGFLAVLPASLEPATIERVEVVEPATGAVLARLERSAAAPDVRLVSPQPSSLLEDQVDLAWTAADADGDALRHYVRYSPDGERIVPLAANLTQPGLTVDMTSLPEMRSGRGWLEVLTTDGLNTTAVRAGGLGSGSQLRSGRTNPPWTNVLTPDDGMTFRKGATVVLHASGWDLEDRALEGASLVWASDLDGIVATGRLTTVASLSVGTHVLSVTATDADGNMTSDTTTITVTDRPLPAVVCQPDLGFGGPGTSVLSVCGGDLSSGTSADIGLTGAAPNASAFLVYGVNNNPFPVLGGTLVPIPYLGVQAGTTDLTGAWNLPGAIVGGGGPFTLYGQAVYVDPIFGFGFSNAVQVDVLP